MPRHRATLPSYIRQNQHMWDTTADSYEEQHGATLDLHGGMAWGCWRQPESDLHVLGGLDALAGKVVLDIPCGAARWAIALARYGAHCIGVDISERQLGHARRLMDAADVDFPLICSNAEAVPEIAAASVDVIIHDVGAVLFYDPYRFVPEMSRVLRPGGRFYLLGPTPLHFLCTAADGIHMSSTLRLPYFPPDPLPWRRAATRRGFPEVRFQLPYGGWIRLFRESGLVLEDLIELRAPLRSRTSFLGGDWTRWARRWPLECIWVVSKPAGA